MPGILFEEPTVVSAWLRAASRVAAAGDPPTFIAVTAGAGAPLGKRDLAQLDETARQVGVEKPSSVAEVLLPSVVMSGAGTTSQRLASGWDLFGRSRRRRIRFSGWGHTYFERLTGSWTDRLMVRHPIKANRIEEIIEKINSWGVDVEAALYAHTDIPSDKLRTRGAPCLQYLQFRCFDKDKLEIFATYRAHDYSNKALGNMVGIERLGRFVAEETGRTFVRQTVFSLHPFSGSGKRNLLGFVNHVRALALV